MSEPSPWQETGEREILFTSPFGRKIERRSFQMPSGERADFDLKKEGRAGAVLALTPEKEVVVIRQFRPGPGRVLWDFPGGGIGKEETPEEGVRRELREETGFDGDFRLAGRLFPCAYSTGEKFAFLATDCRRVAEPSSAEKEERGREILTVPFARAEEILRSGEFTAAEIFLAFELARQEERVGEIFQKEKNEPH